MEIKFVLLLPLLLALVDIEGANATCSDPDVLNITADGFQYSTTINPLTTYYKEWWFFTFSDTKTDVAFCMGYSVTDPKNMFGKSMTGMAGMFWPNFQENSTNIWDLSDEYDISDFVATPNNATVSIGGRNHIEVVNETTYLVAGSSKDGSLQWNLVYTQEVSACRETLEVPLVQLDWISYMPSAQVDGVVVYEGRKIPIHGQGYHDHNWGVWPTAYFNWVWAQYSDVSQNFGFVMGAYRVYPTKEYIGYIFVRLHGVQAKLGTLCADYFNLVPEKFAKWNGHQYSTQNHVEVEGKNLKLSLDYATVTSGVNPGGTALNLLVFEQISQFNVTLYQSDGKGGWVLKVNSTGLGFNEWSDVVAV